MKKMGKQRLFIAAGVFIFIMVGCGQKAEKNQEIPQKAVTSEEYSEKEQREDSHDPDVESIAELYRDIYDYTKRHQHTPNLSMSVNWHGL